MINAGSPFAEKGLGTPVRPKSFLDAGV